MSDFMCPICNSNSVYVELENEDGYKLRCVECLTDFVEWKDD